MPSSSTTLTLSVGQSGSSSGGRGVWGELFLQAGLAPSRQSKKADMASVFIALDLYKNRENSNKLSASLKK
jgi:hypothetical protein